MELIFEWDENKARNNVRKHQISFDEAKTVFYDPFLLTFPDPFHADEEERFLNLGRSSQGRVLVVAPTERHKTIRIISARRATLGERRAYEEGDYERYA